MSHLAPINRADLSSYSRFGEAHLRQTAMQFGVGVLWVLLSVGAVWAAVPGVRDRWFQPWGSVTSAGIFLVAFGGWLYLLTTPQRGALRVAPATAWLIGALLSLVVYTVALPWAPQLITSELAAAVVGCTMIGTLAPRLRKGAWGILVLMLLSIHVATSLDFFIGFPLRLVSSQLAGLLLGPNGSATGAALTDGHELYFVDAPCSGVRMLSASIALGAALSALYQFNLRRTVLLVATSIVLAIFGNAHRAATLFLVRSDPQDDFHSLVGVVVFTECALLLLLFSGLIARWKWLDAAPRYSRFRLPAPRALAVVFVIACAAAASSPALHNTVVAPAKAFDSTSIVWPTTWNGETLEPVPMPPGTEAWVRNLPGEWAQFRVGTSGKRVMLRLCHGATRDLHSAQNCYLAMGGTCTPRNTRRDEEGRLWSGFFFQRHDGSEEVTVRECYFALRNAPTGDSLESWLAGAESWPDVSAWFWAASLPGSEVGTTLAITVAE